VKVATLATGQSSSLLLGGLLFRIQAEHACFPVCPDTRYQEFFSAAHSGTEETITVRIIENDFAVSMAGWNRLFDTEETWQMWGRGALRRLIYQPDPSGPCFTKMQFDPSGSVVDCWVGQPWRVDGSLSGRIYHPVLYPVDVAMVMYLLASRGGLVVHGCGAVRDGKAVLFPGVSGSGKSTLARLLVADGWRVLSDDRVIVHEQPDGSFRYHGTPWLGEADLAEATDAAGIGVCFLRKGNAHAIYPVTASQAFLRLLPVVSVPWYDPVMMDPILATCGRFTQKVRCGELTFKRDAGLTPVLMDWLKQR